MDFNLYKLILQLFPKWDKRKKSASCPLMITGQMWRQLHDMGFTNQQIREMTPQQAWDHLSRKYS